MSRARVRVRVRLGLGFVVDKEKTYDVLAKVACLQPAVSRVRVRVKVRVRVRVRVRSRACSRR